MWSMVGGLNLWVFFFNLFFKFVVFFNFLSYIGFYCAWGHSDPPSKWRALRGGVGMMVGWEN